MTNDAELKTKSLTHKVRSRLVRIPRERLGTTP